MPKEDTQFKPVSDQALSKQNLALKVQPDIYRRIKAIPRWQDKLREALPLLIEEWESSN